MIDTSQFKRTFDAWKSGKSYWEASGKTMPGYQDPLTDDEQYELNQYLQSYKNGKDDGYQSWINNARSFEGRDWNKQQKTKVNAQWTWQQAHRSVGDEVWNRLTPGQRTAYADMSYKWGFGATKGLADSLYKYTHANNDFERNQIKQDIVENRLNYHTYSKKYGEDYWRKYKNGFLPRQRYVQKSFGNYYTTPVDYNNIIKQSQVQQPVSTRVEKPMIINTQQPPVNLQLPQQPIQVQPIQQQQYSTNMQTPIQYLSPLPNITDIMSNIYNTGMLSVPQPTM